MIRESSLKGNGASASARFSQKIAAEGMPDPTTRREIRMPVSECASSHMARRTFCGNLYKRVKDPNIVASMSGHKEGSKALARYREIDKDIKRDALKVFEAI